MVFVVPGKVRSNHLYLRNVLIIKWIFIKIFIVLWHLQKQAKWVNVSVNNIKCCVNNKNSFFSSYILIGRLCFEFYVVYLCYFSILEYISSCVLCVVYFCNFYVFLASFTYIALLFTLSCTYASISSVRGVLSPSFSLCFYSWAVESLVLLVAEMVLLKRNVNRK